MINSETVGLLRAVCRPAGSLSKYRNLQGPHLWLTRTSLYSQHNLHYCV